MIDLYTLSVVIFFAILGIVIYKDRKNIDFKYILFMRRTKRFRDILDRIAKKSIRFWKCIGTLAFIVSIIVMVTAFYMLFDISQRILAGEIVGDSTVQVALPIPFGDMFVAPFLIGIPFWLWIIAVSIILIPHEAFHGIIARAEKIRLKDVGLMLLAIFPGAFVEPDEKQIKKSKLMTKLRIFSAGSFINVVIGILILFIAQSLLWSPNVGGILITNVMEGTPAYDLGLKEGMVIESIDGMKMDINFFDYSFMVLTTSGSNTEGITDYISSAILLNQLINYEPGDTIELKIGGSYYDMTLAEHPDYKEEGFSFPYMGIKSTFNTKDSSMFSFLFPLLALSSLLSILVGAFNILPIFPLDGGLIVQALAERFAKRHANRIVTVATTITLMLLIFNIVGPFL